MKPQSIEANLIGFMNQLLLRKKRTLTILKPVRFLRQ
ncbi:MAG: hypothetical protein CG439_386, partial [Methylococcaceae bacterium NSP1-2]